MHYFKNITLGLSVAGTIILFISLMVVFVMNLPEMKRDFIESQKERRGIKYTPKGVPYWIECVEGYNWIGTNQGLAGPLGGCDE